MENEQALPQGWELQQSREALRDDLCPNCGGDNIQLDGCEYLDPGTVWGTGDCDDCAAHWQMEYRLAAVDTITFPNRECTKSGVF